MAPEMVSCVRAEDGGMKLRSAVVIRAILMAAGLPALAADVQNTGMPTEKRIAAVFDGIGTDKTPGLDVLVKKDGRVVFKRGYGLKELRTGSRIDTKTNFRL